MPPDAPLHYDHALQYATAWAASDHDDPGQLRKDGLTFFGTLGSIDVQFSRTDHVLHAWAFIAPKMGPLLTHGGKMKAHLDQIAQDRPEETGGGVFDIRTLAWHLQATPDMDPCLYLRLDIVRDDILATDVAAAFKKLSDAAYIWHRHKFSDTFMAFYRDLAKEKK
jgi:hypothetical protein